MIAFSCKTSMRLKYRILGKMPFKIAESVFVETISLFILLIFYDFNDI